MGLKRKDEARRSFEDANKLWSDPYSLRIQLVSGLSTNNMDMVGTALSHMLAQFPNEVRKFDFEMLQWLVREDSKSTTSEAQDRLISLARLRYPADDSHGDYIAYLAMKALLKRGQAADAAAMLPYVKDPSVFQALLIEKRYSALWSDAGKVAGPQMLTVQAASVDRAQKRYDENPTDTDALSQLAFALEGADRHEEIVALRERLPSIVDGVDEHTGWLFDSVARALYETGRGDEGDKVYSILNESPALPDSWRVSMKINRIHYLVSTGKFDRAIPLLEGSEKLPGSPYAMQLIRRMKYCALNGVGRKDEAARILPDILAHQKDSYDTAIEALFCAGQFDQAEKLTLEALSDEDFQSSFVAYMQPSPLGREMRSIWSDGWDQLRKRPSLVKEFERLGRPMPKEFLPRTAARSS